MNWRNSNFVASYEYSNQCPTDERLELAFIGRSNVGKSSLINALLEHKGIAKVSGTPGKTQTLNYYNVDDNFYLVDLPGYGYARVSKKQRLKFKSLIENYIYHRPTLICTMVLLDSRIKPMDSDLEFISNLGERNVPLIVVYTKCDKLKESDLKDNIKKYEEALLESWSELPISFQTSAKTANGINELRTYLTAQISEIYQSM